MTKLFDDLYPNVAWWAAGGGWIELGQEEFSRSMIRVLDIGGLLWEDKENYDTVATALAEAETFIIQWREENGKRCQQLSVSIFSNQRLPQP